MYCIISLRSDKETEMLNGEIELVEENVENNVFATPETSSGIAKRNSIMKNLRSNANK